MIGFYTKNIFLKMTKLIPAKNIEILSIILSFFLKENKENLKREVFILKSYKKNF